MICCDRADRCFDENDYDGDDYCCDVSGGGDASCGGTDEVVRSGGVFDDGDDEDTARFRNSRRIRLMKLLKSPCRFKDSVRSARLGNLGSHWTTRVIHIQLMSQFASVFCHSLLPS